MSIFVTVKGGKIQLQPDPDWTWKGFDGDIEITGTQSLLSVDNKPIIIQTDFPQTHQLGKNYSTQNHSTPGTVQSVLLSVNQNTLSTQVFSEAACVTEDTGGSFQAVVTQPALTPNGVPDPLLLKSGQWRVVEPGQEIMVVEAPAPRTVFLDAESTSIAAKEVPNDQEKLATKAEQKLTTKVEESPKSDNQVEDLVENIIVLVAGTVDPGNLNLLIRANSSKSSDDDSHYYWKESHTSLVNKIKEYSEKDDHCHFFDAHSWSGDNAVINRKTAGSYLADRWCGSNDEVCYYPAFKNKEVRFHFIGHSHGGNVINEITNRMAEIPEWPEKWKVKTIVYLSTPFFQKLHQVNTEKFHDNCQMVNVFNKYDLTQRVIANFSLKHLPELETILINNIHRLFKNITNFNLTVLKALREPSRLDMLLKVCLHIFSFKLIKVELDWNMGQVEGKECYTECSQLFSNIDSLFDETKNVVTFLNTEVELKLPKGLKEKNIEKRQIISDQLKELLLGQIGTIQDGLKKTHSAFEKRMKQGKYPILGFFNDVSAFITPILDLLSIHSEALTGPLSDLVYGILIELIDEYDNTANSPNHQLPKKYQSIPVDVTQQDPYCGLKDQQFDDFITRIETIETDYAQNQTQQSLLDIIFTLIAQLEFIHKNLSDLNQLLDEYSKNIYWWDVFDWFISQENTDFEKIAKRLIEVLKSYAAIFQSRNGDIVAESDHPKMHDLKYFISHSHAISRLELYQEIADVLKAQLGID